MRRLTAILAASVVIFASGQVPALHIHADPDHDHPEHHHGPAVHDHAHAKTADEQPPDGTPRLERCDPGTHAISLTGFCAAAPQGSAIDAESVMPAGSALGTTSTARIAPTDVRVHGPPGLIQSPPRAPPAPIPTPIT